MTGASGSGKSDLALRMILEKGAVLIADDRTDIRRGANRPVASCPETIKGLLEVRGVGIVTPPAQAETEVFSCCGIGFLPGGNRALACAGNNAYLWVSRKKNKNFIPLNCPRLIN